MTAANTSTEPAPGSGTGSGTGTGTGTDEQPFGPPARGNRLRRVATIACWPLLVPALAWAVMRLAGLERGPLAQAVAFTPYVLLWTLVPLGLALALRRFAAAGIAALVTLALAAVVVPRALPDSQPDPTGPALRVLTANLLFGGADPAALIKLVRDERVDVLALQEFTPESAGALDRLGLAELLPHRQLGAESGAAGSALYARFPLRDGGVRLNAGGFNQAYATVLVPGAPPVLVESVHPMAPHSLAVLPAWRMDLEAEPPATPEGPLRVLAGDFNATLDHAALRQLLSTGYVDAADANGSGLLGTWGPYDGDWIPPVAIDHVLADRRIGVHDVRVHPLAGSDHRPVLAVLSLPAA